MPNRRRTLTPAVVTATLAESFVPQPVPRWGVEVEWPTHPHGEPSARTPEGPLLAATTADLPCGGRVTIEPGGQVELSTRPEPTVDAALDAVAADAAALHAHLARANVDTLDRAIDTGREPCRVLGAPRYTCMERFFAARGDAGAWMMCNTASVQLNLGHHPQDPDRRWALVHRLGPVLVAAFANSPGLDTTGRRWESLRQAIWWSIDPGRARPPGGHGSARLAWLDYVLAADVMLVRSPDGTGAAPLAPGFAFGRWMAEGHPAGWPTVEDLRYHLTTLFPPVRPRGWLELRMLDLLPPRLREVATVVVATALTTEAAPELERRLPSTQGLWCAAARYGLAHPALAAAARTLFDAVREAMGQVTTDLRRRDQVGAFAERHVATGRSPAQLVGAGALTASWRPTLGADVLVGPAAAH